MEKTGELKPGVSRCDRCGNVASVVYDVRALCTDCARAKSAADIVSLKSAPPTLSEEHKPEPKSGE